MVSSYCQLLERRYKDQLDRDGQEFIAYAVDGARRMKVLIGDLLTYSRVGTRERNFQQVDCQDALDQGLANLATAIEESGAAITHGDLPTVVADPTQLTQLFQNLAGNAIKYRGDQSPQVHIGAERTNGRWTFSVSDNGIGIEPRYADRIFGVFERLHGNDEYSGTGIGLAVCKKIVERHGGSMWVDSNLGEGSTFYFAIPA